MIYSFDLNNINDKNCFNLDVFTWIFRLLSKMFIMIMESLKKARKESAILLNNKDEQCNKQFLLVGDRFMPNMHLRQSGFTYSPCGQFPKYKDWIHKLKEKVGSRYIDQNEFR